MPTSTTFPTKDQIENLIEDIVTGGDYTANELRLLLTNILNSLYGPFYNAASNPAAGSNQTANYKAGSLGKNSSTGRYFVCSSAAASTATWEQISLDKGYQAIVGIASTTYQVSSNTSIVSFSSNQNNVTINLPVAANSYEGKVVRVYFSSPATLGSLTFAVPEVVPVTIISATSYTANAFVEFTFRTGSWVVTQYVKTIVNTDFQRITIANNGTGTISPTTATLQLAGSSIGRYTVIMPTNPYIGKVVKIFTTATSAITTAVDFRLPDNTLMYSTAMASNESIEFVNETIAGLWTRIPPSI
jgi:hypothetical protein